MIVVGGGEGAPVPLFQVVIESCDFDLWKSLEWVLLQTQSRFHETFQFN